MGYDHTMERTGEWTPEQWAGIVEDVGAILAHVAGDGRRGGVRTCGIDGHHMTRPVLGRTLIAFNGRGREAHEPFHLRAARGEDEPELLGVKTNRKPYDLAVTAVMATISSVHGGIEVTSDGTGNAWLAGVAAAKAALPAKADRIDLPMGVMRADRWVGPWVSGSVGTGYEVRLCVDGRGYVFREDDGETAAFADHAALARWLAPDLAETWRATGRFDEARHDGIRRRQARLCRTLLERRDAEGLLPEGTAAPDHVRPGQYRLRDEIAPIDFDGLLREAA